MSAQMIEKSKAEMFAEKMLGMINGSAITVMTSIGHRTGLFDQMAKLPASTSEEIAEAANLNERYVREWLGAMVTGGIVDYDAATATYQLPPEHAAFLTRAASPDNLAVAAQFIPLLGSVEDKIIECFRHGGGVAYVDYPRFHELMAEESSQTVGAALLDAILPLIPEGIERLQAGVYVLDVGCGSGRSIIRMAEAFPNSRFVGYDFSEEAITAAQAEAETRGVKNVRFKVKDVANLNEPGHYDIITAFDAIHDQAQPRKVLKGVAESLRPGGTFLMQDIRSSSHVDKNLDHPVAPYLYTISCMHCMSVSLAAGGEGLGAMWGEEKARQLLNEAGFTNVELKQLPHDFMNSYFIATKS